MALILEEDASGKAFFAASCFFKPDCNCSEADINNQTI